MRDPWCAGRRPKKEARRAKTDGPSPPLGIRFPDVDHVGTAFPFSHLWTDLFVTKQEWR